jgi:SHS2 domain-containing protein
MKTYETFDHTADIGVRAFGRTVEEVFVHAAEALFEMLTDLDSIRLHLTREVEINGSDPEDLFVRWLGELLYLCQGEEYLFREFSIFQLTPTSLKAQVRGERFDPSRHELKTEIKAITYHQVEVAQKDGGWVGKVIFDI